MSNPKLKPQNPQPPENGKPIAATNGNQPVQKPQSIDELVAIRKELAGIREELVRTQKDLTLKDASGVALATIVTSIVFPLFGFMLQEMDRVNKAKALRDRIEQQTQETNQFLKEARERLCQADPSSEQCQK